MEGEEEAYSMLHTHAWANERCMMLTNAAVLAGKSNLVCVSW
jgi:hypothetical protein